MDMDPDPNPDLNPDLDLNLNLNPNPDPNLYLDHQVVLSCCDEDELICVCPLQRCLVSGLRPV